VIDLDSREQLRDPKGFARRFQRLCKKEKIECYVETLLTGDIRFLTSDLQIVLMERKSTDSDLFTSMSGRLQDQLARIVEAADKPYLLIDGPLYLGKGETLRSGRYPTSWKFHTIWNQLETFRDAGGRVVWVPWKRMTPIYIVECYRYWQKSDHTSLLQSHANPFPTRVGGPTPTEKKLRVLLSISGLGPGLAKRLLTVFGSVNNISGAPLEGLMAVPGIGEDTAKKILDVLN